jgi:hypothetical protein
MIKAQCTNCTFFSADDLECRRFPPTFHEFPVVRPTDWCGEFKEVQTKPSLFTTATTAIIKASLPAASEAKLRKHKRTLEEVLGNSPSEPNAKRISELLEEVEVYLALSNARRYADEEAAAARHQAEEENRPTLESVNQSVSQAIYFCKQAKNKGFTWPREAAEMVNEGAIPDDEWSEIALYWEDAWDQMLVGE